ncbi:SGNH/GDSL hydrolase family protein [Donghicola eburneus]|uniref:SGNH/GDSL hydrolase family protein n=1 Tax=Donghicola eburneus TaxID=393278 RepID=UPI0008EEB866|nr:SGNH/GDSL hydrolase family protein [Donghicola eburneus]SFQ52569.1 GDSL-like Lipase/Acylhydrolase family protein [Donghicola eburneus]
MTYPHGGAGQIWRDGVGGAYKPKKQQIRDWGRSVETKVDANTAAFAQLQALNASGAPMYADTAAGLAATSDGDYFNVPSADDDETILLYRNDTGSATLVKAYPSAEAVQQPSWVGRVNGWPDPFFRRITPPSSAILGRDRWWGNNSAGQAFGGWTLVDNPVFNGKALQRAAGYGVASYSGPKIWLDEIGAAEGDTVTAYVLVVSLGGTVTALSRFVDDADALVGSNLTSYNEEGGTGGITATGVPKWLRVEAVVPSGATAIAVGPYASAGTSSFDLVACWAFKGPSTDGPAWPIMPESGRQLVEDDFEARISANEANAAPYVAWEHPSGDDEMAGDSEWSTSVVGGYEAVDVQTRFNVIEYAVRAEFDTTDIEWRVWIRPSAASFNMYSETPDQSGTIAAGDFPTASGGIYALKLPDTLVAEAGEHVFWMFRAADGSRIYLAHWLYDAGASPARHGFPFAATSTWNIAVSMSNPNPTYGQVAGRLLFEDPSHRVLAAEIDGLQGTPIELVLPPKVYALEGQEANVYFDNLLLASDYRDYDWEVTCTASEAGVHQSERWTLTPGGAISSGDLTVAALDKATGETLASASSSVLSASASAGSGSVTALFIGDSITNAGTISQTILDLAGADAGISVSLIGTRGTAPNLHEGRGGWSSASWTTAGPTYYEFTVSGVVVEPIITGTEYTNNGATFRVQEVDLTGGAGTITCQLISGSAPAASGTLTKSNAVAGDDTIAFSAAASQPGNPFWIGGGLDFAQYLVDHSLATPDWVFIQIGTNDVFGFTGPDATDSAAADSLLTDLNALLTDILSADVGINIGLMVPPPPAASQDAFGNNYGTGVSKARNKRAAAIWARQLIAMYGDSEASRIYLVPSNLNIDTVHGYSPGSPAPANARTTVEISRPTNAVHPNTSGYQQIADAVWAFLKCQL